MSNATTAVAYPERQPDTVRPYRIWDPQSGAQVIGRAYISERRAHDQALVLIRWEHTGASLEVLDARTMAWRGTYTRRIDSIRIETLRKVESNGRTETRQAASA